MTILANPRFRLFTGATLISFSPILANLVSVSPTTIGFYRVLIGGAALAAFLLLTGRKLSFSRTVWLALFAAAVFFALDLWFWHRSIVYIGPGLSTLLANMQVFFMMAAGVLFLGQRPTLRQLVAVPLAIVGLAMVVGLDWNNLSEEYQIGVVLGLLTAVSYAGYMLSMRRARMDAVHAVPVREVAVMSLLVALMLGVTALVEGESLRISTASDFSWLVAYGLLCHALGLMFIASSLATVKATEIGIALLLQPALSFLWDIIFFSRPVSIVEGVGAVIALLAIFLGSMRPLQQPQRAT